MYDYRKVTNHLTKKMFVFASRTDITVKVEEVIKDEEDGKDRIETVDNI